MDTFQVSLNKIGGATSVFFGVYFFLQEYIHYIFPFPISKSPLLLSKYVSFLHGLFVAVCSTLFLLDFLSFELWNQLQYFIVGYCIYDTILSFGKTELYIRMPGCMPLHHVLLAMFSFFLFPYHPVEVSIGYLAEWTNPLMHACYHMLHTPHKKYTTLLCVLKVCLIFTFFWLRVINFTYLLILAISTRRYIGILGMLPLTIMNVWWFIKICYLARA